MSFKAISELITTNHIEFVDLRFTDTRGKEQHVALRSHQVDAAFLEIGKMFDGSSIAGWRSIAVSDMMLKADPDTAIIDPFCETPTLILRCDVIDPQTMQPYNRDPRAVAKRAEKYLHETKIADQCFFGPEPEFFIFDDVRWEIEMNAASYFIDSHEAAWNSGKEISTGNLGHRPAIKGGYFPVPPVDSSNAIRAEMCLLLEKMGLVVEAHHHEVATSNQNEISTRFNTLVRKADEMQLLKYVVHNVAYRHGKTATFMPKPLVGDNGSGMHCHQSLLKDNTNLFAGDLYAGLSEMGLYYIGGILKHAKTLNAFTNPTTNSYKRLVPGFEAPVFLAYGSCNRSAAIRIPHCIQPRGRRIEVRFPDAVSNPYLAFAAMLMAGLDGIQKRIHPGNAMDEDLYELDKHEARHINTVCFSLEEALDQLSHDRDFLLAGGVFNNDLIDAYIEMKNQDIQRLRMTTHPVEFDMYYSL
jgi:glutamine synthetase